jgi:glyoxylase-like metal-dependent hydrolase (beta-lactamase superfamily II)
MLLNPEKNLSFFLGKKIYSPPADRYVKDGEKIRIGSLNLKVIHTPGHSPGSICLEIEKFIFTGDTLFAQGIGRTDFPGASFRDIRASIREKLFQIDEGKIIYPGHGNYSTIGEEKRNQTFF